METPKGGWLQYESNGNEEEKSRANRGKGSGELSTKSVMVYLLDKETLRKEPIGIITEQRKSERDGNNVIGMLRLARKEFANTEEMANRIVIGEYVE